MRHLMEPFLGRGFEGELIYSLVIIICSLMVYFGTKELYDLSSYKGIKYFRQAFLFFAIAYFLRSIIKFFMIFFSFGRAFEFSYRGLGELTLFLFMYFSSLAIFYLLYSFMWKKWNGDPRKKYYFHVLAFVIGMISILAGGFQIYVYLNLLLLIFIAFVIYLAHKTSEKKKKGHNLYTIYMLFFVFLILNIIDILIPRFLEVFQLFIYLASLGIFLLILYKVLRKTGS